MDVSPVKTEELTHQSVTALLVNSMMDITVYLVPLNVLLALEMLTPVLNVPLIE